MNKCNDCRYFDKLNNDGGACHAMPPTLMRHNDEINEHRPYVNLDAIACTLYKRSYPEIEGFEA